MPRRAEASFKERQELERRSWAADSRSAKEFAESLRRVPSGESWVRTGETKSQICSHKS